VHESFFSEKAGPQKVLNWAACN